MPRKRAGRQFSPRLNELARKGREATEAVAEALAKVEAERQAATQARKEGNRA